VVNNNPIRAIHIYMYTYIHLYTYIHTLHYIHTYIYTYIHIHIWAGFLSYVIMVPGNHQIVPGNPCLFIKLYRETIKLHREIKSCLARKVNSTKNATNCTGKPVPSHQNVPGNHQILLGDPSLFIKRYREIIKLYRETLHFSSNCTGKSSNCTGRPFPFPQTVPENHQLVPGETLPF
jgi:hypothetical protein